MADRIAAINDLLAKVRPGGLRADTALLRQVIDIDIAARLRAWHVRVVRPEDLLILDFQFLNLKRSGATVVRIDSGQPAYLFVEHPPQAIADETYPELADQNTETMTGQGGLATSRDTQGHVNTPPPAPQTVGVPVQVPVRIAHASRLVFTMPAGVAHFDWTLDALLEACATWPLSLDGAAQPDPDAVVSRRPKWLAAELSASVSAARSALGGTIGAKQFAALDAAALRLGDTASQAVQRGGEINPAVLERTMAEAVESALASERRAVDPIDRVAATLYVRAAASHRTVIALERASDDIAEVVKKLPPDYFGILLAPHPIRADRTALELPYRLNASPLATAGFSHARTPVEHHGRTELWHTRLGTRAADGHVDDRAPEKLRYLWSPDYLDETVATDVRLPLDKTDRRMIVQLTAGYDEVRDVTPPNDIARIVKPFIPRPVVAKRLMLTALGGYLDSERHWDPRPDGVDLSSWTQRTALARDHYVRVEYNGFLLPFGHAATLVKISERKFQWRDAAKTDRIAVLRQRYFIIVREKVKTYPQAAPQPHDGRGMPFISVHCLVQTTPDLLPAGEQADARMVMSFYDAQDPRAPVRMVFWPQRGPATDYQFPMAGIDGAGRKVPFETPLLFVSEVQNIASHLPAIRTYYNSAANASRRQIGIHGATVRFAESDGGAAADVDIPTDRIDVKSVDPTSGIPANQSNTLQQFPLVDSANVKLAAVQRLTGIDKAPTVRFDDAYLAAGFAGNAAELFLRLQGDNPVQFGGSGASSDKVGGLATPDLAPKALSRRHGVASGDLGQYAGGTFDPKDFFGDAKLLGFFKLSDLLKGVGLGSESPQLTTNELPDAIETVFRLEQAIPKKSILDSLLTGEGGSTQFTLVARTTLHRDGSAPSTTIDGSLTHFKLNLVGCIIIHFDRLAFKRVDGRKPDVDVDLNPDDAVTFGGPLEFINALKEFIPANGFSDPPSMSVTPAGITAGYSLALPNVQVGILSLSNISLGAAFSLPFTGKPPTARFNFAERHNTFNLTVSLFGGGGFFAMVVSADGVEEIEAALEFGAQIAIDLGVASGGVYVKGGFYFHYAKEKIEFEGYVEIGGHLSVLGLISVTLTFHLSLAYELIDKSAGNPKAISRLFGQATLTVEIDILFFSMSVGVTVEKTFAGSESDPLFIDFVPNQTVWDEYCQAYA